jgi:hypothetical protein
MKHWENIAMWLEDRLEKKEALVKRAAELLGSNIAYLAIHGRDVSDINQWLKDAGL